METIGVFFGGKSPEHDVSIITGELIISGLKKLGYPVVPVYIGQDGRWYAGEKLGDLKFFSGQDFKPLLADFPELTLDLEASKQKLVLRERKTFGGKRYEIGIAFPALHGANGEDGSIQGIFQLANVPFVGCGVAASAVAMDKALTKSMAAANGVPVTDFVVATSAEWEKDRKAVLESAKKLTFPLFVKPARLGSSIGITKAKDMKELEFGLEVAFHYDTKAVVEEGVEDVMDVTCALLGNDDPTPSLLLESAVKKDFYSYEDKYLTDGGSQLGASEKSITIPAPLSPELTSGIQRAAVMVYKALGCAGTARVDFLYDKKKGIFYASEVNPLPGTLYHHLWKASGIDFPELLTKLLAFAKERHAADEKLTHTFKSELLDMAKSAKLRIKGQG